MKARFVNNHLQYSFTFLLNTKQHSHWLLLGATQSQKFILLQSSSFPGSFLHHFHSEQISCKFSQQKIISHMKEALISVLKHLKTQKETEKVF